MTTIQYLKSKSWCELSRWFILHNGNAVPVEQRPPNKGLYRATQTHHLVGKTSKGRTDHPSNILRVCSPVHDWLHEHRKAGQVLCCWELNRQGRLDWDALTGLDTKKWPGWMETDDCRDQCQEWPWINRLREKLCQIRDTHCIVIDTSGKVAT